MPPVDFFVHNHGHRDVMWKKIYIFFPYFASRVSATNPVAIAVAAELPPK